jgi:SOS response regulatory protein OraA/RecX
MATKDADYVQQLADYLKKNISKGYTMNSLKWALINQGHSRTEIQMAIELANKQMAEAAPKMIEKPVIKFETEPPMEEKKKGFFARLFGR